MHCYREALKDIPEDQLVYGTLRDDLTRALENVIRDHNGHVTRSTLVPGAGNGPGDGPGGGAAGGSHDKGFFHWLANKVGPSTANSVRQILQPSPSNSAENPPSRSRSPLAVPADIPS